VRVLLRCVRVFSRGACACSPTVCACVLLRCVCVFSRSVCVCSPAVCACVLLRCVCVFSRGVCVCSPVVCVLPWCVCVFSCGVCVLPWCVYALSNPSLRELPPELGQLGNLWQLDIEDLNIINVPAEIRKEGRASSASQAPPPRERCSSLAAKDLE